jgi:hypothetical protein
MTTETKPVRIVRESQNIDRFGEAISYKSAGYLANTFNYIAVKDADEFCIWQARLFLNTGTPAGLRTHFQSERVRAGSYALEVLQLSVQEVMELNRRFARNTGGPPALLCQ